MERERNPADPFWKDLQYELEDQLLAIQKEESNVINMASRARQTAIQLLHRLQEKLRSDTFQEGEEILFYKEIKPWFISQVIYHSRLLKIETDKPPTDATGLEVYYTSQLTSLGAVYDEHRFIHRYMTSGSTYLDEKLFFHPGPDSAFALNGVEPPVDGAFPVCYDHVVGQLKAADLLERYLLESLEQLKLPGHNAGNPPKITWTAPKAHFIELVYALYATGVFNNRKVPLKEVFEALETAFQIKSGNYARTMQEILYRKSGYTVFQDGMKNDYLLYIQRIEDKHIG